MRRTPRMPEIEEPGTVRISRHEGAVVGALEQRVSGKKEDLARLIEEEISRLARWTEEKGGLVGHIKASLQTPGGTLFFSCTGDEVQCRELPDTGERLSFTAILFFVAEEQLKNKLEALRNQL